VVLARAIEKRSLLQEGRRLREQVESKSAFCGMIGCSVPMQRVYQAVQAVADSNASVLVRGESGTGKELVAQATFANRLQDLVAPAQQHSGKYGRKLPNRTGGFGCG
jgi:transcriptional regulator with GAF, ATPase, and Fis domain